jgi:tetratricopeptide (TPR) repeat protein
MYLQDLYRFYRLFPQRNELRTPFNTKIRPDNTVDTAAFFYTQKVFRQTGLESTVLELATFLANHNRLGNLYDLCSTYLYNNEGAVLTDNVKLLLLGAKACDYVGDPVAEDLYQKVLELEPDNDAALRRMGQTAFEREDYATAKEFYSRLASLDASRKSHLLGLCITLLKLGETDEAMRTIFKLDYEHPNDINVRRAKAWGLMEQGKLEQAREEYTLITADKRTVDADQLNSGYCEWFMGNIEAALNHFRNYVNMQEEKDYDLRNDFLHDVNTLQRHGITDIDMVLMLELV